MRVVGITGLAGSGKTTIARYLMEQYDYTRIRFADPLKAMLRELGYSIAIYPTTALLAAANAAVAALRGIGGSDPVARPMSRMEDFFRLVGLDEWLAISEKWSGEPPQSGGSPDHAVGSSGAW